MFNTFKRPLQILVGVALVMQMAGCYYYAGDRRYHPYWYHHDEVVVHVHD